MTTTPKQNALERVTSSAIEQSNLVMLEFACEQGFADWEGLLPKAIDIGNKQIITNLVEKILRADTPKIKTHRPLVIHDIKLDMPNDVKRVGKNSAFMVTLIQDPVQAEKDLDSGTVSLEELNHQNNQKWTPLMYLCCNARNVTGSLCFIQKLLDAGVDVNAVNSGGSTALMYACRYSGEKSMDEVVALLLKHPKIDVNILDDSDEGFTALMYATRYYGKSSSKKTLKMLLDHPKIDVNCKTHNGSPILQGACFFNPLAEQTVKLLLDHPNIDADAVNQDGDTALMRAVQHIRDKQCPKAVVKLMWEHPKVDINIESKSGKTAFDYMLDYM